MKLKVRASELQPGDRWGDEVVSSIERVNNVRINIKESFTSYLKEADTLLEIERGPRTTRAGKLRRNQKFYTEQGRLVEVAYTCPGERPNYIVVIGWWDGNPNPADRVWFFYHKDEELTLA